MYSSEHIAPDLMMSVVLGLTIFGMYLKPYRPKCTKVLGWTMFATILACVSDAMLFVKFDEEIWFIQQLLIYVYFISGNVLLILFCWYSYAYVSEKTSVKLFFHVVPMSMLSIAVIILIAMCLRGELFTSKMDC